MEIGSLLDKNETAVFKACYDNSLEKQSNIIDVREATRSIAEGGLSTEQVQDCLEIILKRHLCNEYIGKSGSGRISIVQTNTYGFILYANAFMPEIDRLHADVLDAVVHGGLKSHQEVAAHLRVSKFLVSCIFDILEDQGRIQTVKAMGDVHEILLITAEGRKAAGKAQAEQRDEPRIEHEGVDLMKSIDISEKADKRNRVLVRVYLEANGNPTLSVSDDVVVEKEGVTHEELMQEIQPYLESRRLINFQGFKATAISQEGIDKVEKELLAQAKAPIEARGTSEKVHFAFIADPRIEAIVERDYLELQKLDANQATKAVLVLSGGIIEGLIFDALVVSGKWTFEKGCEEYLNDMIGAAKHRGIISEDRLTDAIRRYRNLIHPGREIKYSMVFSESDASLARHAVDIIVREVRAWHSKNPGV